MAAAEQVDPLLKAGVHNARADGVRCFKTVVRCAKAAAAEPLEDDEDYEDEEEPEAMYYLKLTHMLKEQHGKSLEDEFKNCLKEFLNDTAPCLLLFRADVQENLQSSRWLLLAWLPEAAPETERMAHLRSCGQLSRTVPEPYFLRELLASRRRELAWPVVRDLLFS